SIVFQALIHIAVSVGIVPITGQPLPMVSMGGSSLWFSSISIGILLSISRKVDYENIIQQPDVQES
ncbi:MAG TPA: FtsW/RodA/SpoVE family cell cycle protein, partial [Bacteroidales bacterium]|nr:FtsW/RodA/SpoVE family cell cycle protein [Bacteroidales bacterium]